MAADNIKPRTVPYALGLTDRKYKAIYETVEESLIEKNPIEALVELTEMFPERNELTFAIYVYAMKIGYAKAEKKFKDAIPEIAKKGVEFGAMATLNQLKEMEARGMIKIVDIDPDNLKCKPDISNIPDDILYGGDYTGSNNNPASGAATNNRFKSIDPDVSEKPATKKKDEDIMYG